MPTRILCAAVLFAGLLTVQGKLIFLGDSWTDVGLKGILSGGQLVEDKLSNGEIDDAVYPPSPYYQGTFSNGPVWAEVTAENVGQKEDNFAAGGAGTRTGGILVKPPYGYLTSPVRVPVHSLVQQASAVADLKSGAINPSIDYGIIFIGIDEVYEATTATQPTPVKADEFESDVAKSLSTLYSAGIRTFAVLTIPPLDKFPFATNTSGNSVSSAASSLNGALLSAVNSFNKSNSAANVIIYNTSTLFEAVLANPKSSEWGTPFTNTADPARNAPNGDLDTTQAAGVSLGNAADPTDYIFWDELHPTKHFHHVLANDFSTKVGGQLNAKPAPAGTYT